MTVDEKEDPAVRGADPTGTPVGQGPASIRRIRGTQARRARRGTAEIELILSVMIFITLLLLVQGAVRLGLSRMDMLQQAEFDAFNNATAQSIPQDVQNPDIQPVVGFANLRPGLPNRVHAPQRSVQVTVATGDIKDSSLPPVEVGGAAALAAPPWMYCAFPVGGGDSMLTQQWFLDWASESHTQAAMPLGLAPAWAP